MKFLTFGEIMLRLKAFFQAEDGIRDIGVTGVQTCALPIYSIPRAAAELSKNGFTLDESTAKYKGEKMVAVYLKQEFGGFAVHLLQK